MTNLGIYGARTGVPLTEPKISYQVQTSISQVRESKIPTHIIWKGQWYDGPGWTKNTQWPVTNIEWVKSRFDLYEQYKNEKWEYGTYLGMEELFHPAIMAQWFPTPPSTSYPDIRYDALATWTIDGEYTRYGLNVKALKPWYIANKGAWTTSVQSWWNTAKANNRYNDPVIFEWSLYYARQLYEMWNLHMHALGKKSCIAGYIGIPLDINGASPKYINNIWGTVLHNYNMANYDMIIAYQYPECVSSCVAGQPNPLTLYPNHLYHTNRNISWSVDAAKILKPLFKGNFTWILTAHWPDSVGTSNKSVQFAEYKAMLPYVDVMMLPEFSEMRNEGNKNPWPGSDYSPPLLAEFCTATNTCVSTTTGTLDVSSTPLGAKIFIDGVDQIKTTRSVIQNIPSGSHTLKLTLSGYQDYSTTFTINSGATTTLNPTLTPVSTTTCGTIQIGSRGDAVFVLQLRLHQLGFYRGLLDGIFGSYLDYAVRAYQSSKGLFVDGVVKTDTWISLGVTSCALSTCPVIKIGTSGNAVIALQTKLKQIGYYTGALDGIYGSSTIHAVILYKIDNGLAVDDVVGTYTWTSLGIMTC